MNPGARSIGRSNRPPFSSAHDRATIPPRRARTGRALMADPLDKQLVEAVLTRPRRAKADVEEARLATRNLRAAKVVLPKVASDEDEDDDDLELGPEPGTDGAAADGGDVAVEVVGEDGVAVDNKMP